MKIKRFLVKLLFNRRQRQMIYKALVYSAYAYRKRGNVDKAVLVQTVLNEISGKLGIIPDVYTKEEVDRIVSNVMSDAEKFIRDAYFSGKEEAVKELEGQTKPTLAVGTVIDLKKCEKCENKDGCFISKAISEIELEDKEQEEEQPSQETTTDENSDDKTETEETTQN